MEKLRQVLVAAGALSVAAIFAGCSGGAGARGGLLSPLAASNALAPASKNRVAVRLVVKVPKRHAHGRGTRFISPSTQSIGISFSPSGGGTPVKINKNVTPTTNGCAPSGGGTLCTFTVPLNPGKYVATINTYEGLNQSGNVLSHGENLAVVVKVGKANDVSLTIGGVPHSLAISASDVAMHGTQAGGFTLYGAAAQQIIITAIDAGGNTIVGAGTPYVGSVTAGSGWAISASPAPATPNQLMVAPPNSNGSAATLNVAVDYKDGTCSLAGVVCSASFNIKNDIQILAITDCEVTCGLSLNPDAVKLYLPPYTAPFATITNEVYNPLGVAFDGAGDLFVANCGKTSCGAGTTLADSVKEYQPPYTGAPVTTITNGVAYPNLIGANAAGDVFVNVCNYCLTFTADTVNVYVHGNLTGSPKTIVTGGNVYQVTADPAGEAIVSACRLSCGYGPADAILQLAAPYTSAPTAIHVGVSSGSNGFEVAFDSAATMYVGNCYSCSTFPSYAVTKNVVPYTVAGNPTQFITSGMGEPLSLALDSEDNLFVGIITPVHEILQYQAPSYSGSGTPALLAGYEPYEIKIDALNNLILSDSDTVQVSAPPYGSMTKVQGGPLTDNTPFALSP